MEVPSYITVSIIRILTSTFLQLTTCGSSTFLVEYISQHCKIFIVSLYLFGWGSCVGPFLTNIW